LQQRQTCCKYSYNSSTDDGCYASRRYIGGIYINDFGGYNGCSYDNSSRSSSKCSSGTNS
jgi:hypothetical protein